MTTENTLSLVLSSLMTMYTISSNSREFDSAAMEAPPAEKIFPFESPTRLPISDCCHVLYKSYRFRVIRVNSIQSLCKRRLVENISVREPHPDFL
jgi:hypothetical protein